MTLRPGGGAGGVGKCARPRLGEGSRRYSEMDTGGDGDDGRGWGLYIVVETQTEVLPRVVEDR